MSGGRLSVYDRTLVSVAGALGPLLIRLVGATWRLEFRNEQVVERIHAAGSGVVFAFWHGTLLPLEYACRGRGIHVLSSLHRDGEMSARLMTSLGYGVVRGSSTRGSARGLMKMLACALDGRDLAITPDGPTGPSGTVKRGIFYLSERSGSPIVPVGVGASSAKRLSSWDSFMIPAPFARVAIVYGEPLDCSASDRFEEKASRLKREIDRLVEEADGIARGSVK